MLTGGGVALAVGAVVALLGVSYGFEQSFLELFEGRQVDLLVFRAGSAERLTSSLDERLGRRIRELPGVAAVAGGLTDMVSFPEKDLIGVPIQGLTHDSFLYSGQEVVRGRRLAADDRRKALLGTVLAGNLGKDLGDQVEIESETFEVVGIFRSFNVFENGSAIVPLSELQRLMGREGQVGGFQVVVDPAPDKGALIERLKRQIDELRGDDGRWLKLSAMPARDYVKSTSQIRVSHAMAWATSAIALVIGAVGMLNTMIMSVFERTREIGILRAIGWRKRRIVGMILGESLVLCLAGAAAGILGAVALVGWLSTFPGASGYVRATIPLSVVAEGLALALTVGLTGGAYPAYRGASLSPMDAIRVE